MTRNSTKVDLCNVDTFLLVVKTKKAKSIYKIAEIEMDTLYNLYFLLRRNGRTKSWRLLLLSTWVKSIVRHRVYGIVWVKSKKICSTLDAASTNQYWEQSSNQCDGTEWAARQNQRATKKDKQQQNAGNRCGSAWRGATVVKARRSKITWAILETL